MRRTALSLLPFFCCSILWCMCLCAGCSEGVETETGDATVRDTGTDAGAAGKCTGVSCSGHGQCALLDDEPICACGKGYYAEGLKCLSLLLDGGTGTDAGGGDGGAKDGGVRPDAAVGDAGTPQGDGGRDGGSGDTGTLDAGADGGHDAGIDPCADHCVNGKQDCGETDTDCGGSCPACDRTCMSDTDCQSGVCRNHFCQASNCADGAQNGDETDIDCGGFCCPCPDGNTCLVAQDCLSKVCKGGICLAPTCNDGVKNGLECGKDCGGPCPTQCPTERILLDVFDGSSICSNGCSRDVQGGLMEAGGWTPQAEGNRLVYDFARHLDCGRLMVEADNFRPHDQFQPRDLSFNYTEFVSLFDGLEDYANDRFTHYAHTSQIYIVYPPGCFDFCIADPSAPNCDGCTENNYTKIKANTGMVEPCDWDSARYCDALDQNKTHYVFELRWTPKDLSLWVDGAQQTYYEYPIYPNACYCNTKPPQMRYLFIGQPMWINEGYLAGPKYVRVELEAPVE